MTETQNFRRTSFRALFMGTCLGLSLLAQPAWAEAPDIKKAAASYDLGRERFREGNYIEAAERFEAADSFAASAAALRLAIAARREAGQKGRSATLAALALARYPDEAQLAGEAQAVIDELGPELAQLSVTCDSPCELVINNRLVHGEASVSRSLYVEPGSIELRANWSDDRSQVEQLNLAAQDSREVSFVAPEIPVAPVVEASPAQEAAPAEQANEPAAEENKGWSPAVFWTGTALTVAGGGAIVGLGLNAINNPGKEAITNGCDAGDETCSLWKEAKRNEMYTNIAIGGTAAVGLFTIVTGIWLTNWKGKKKDEMAQQGPSVRPLVSLGRGAFFGAEGTF